MKKIILLLLCVLLLLPLVGCDKNDEPEWKKKVDSIEVGTTYEELISLMGEPNANVGSGAELLMYILPDEHVTVVCIALDYAQNDYPLTVAVKPVVQTYDEFKEHYQYYPDDPNAWWN